MESIHKLKYLSERLTYYENKLKFKMKRYRGVIHESGLSEMKHNEVMVLKAIIRDLKSEISTLKSQVI